MKEDITKRFAIEFALDLPIFIDDLTLFPFLLKDLMGYYASVRVIKMDKANINPQYIKMSYYNFLCHYITTLAHSEDEEERKIADSNIILFSSLFSLATRKSLLASFSYSSEEKRGEIKLYEIDYDNIDKNNSLYKQAKTVYTLTKEKFDDIREILIKQNDIHYIDYNQYSKDMQELIKKEEERRAKKPPTTTIEDKIDCVMAVTGWRPEDMSKLTIRRFERMYERVVKKVEYQIHKTGAMSGLVSFKDKSILEPWTYSLAFDPLKDLVSDYGDVMNNVKKGLGQM